jgi:DNA-binding CsgD family transcriptional regulator
MFVGREAEVERIERLIEGARRGTGGALVIRGEAGVGKSALLADAAERAGDIRVLRATGIASESELAFAGLMELLRPVLGYVDEIPPLQADALRGALALGPARGYDRFAVGAATLSLLGGVAEREPIVILVDDAHWLDRASLESLLFAARRLTDDSLSVVLSVRSDEFSAVDLAGLEVLDVEGLDLEATTQLVARGGGSSLTHQQVQQVHRSTGGNPLAIVEIVSRGESLGMLDSPIRVSERVEQAFAARVEQLSSSTRTALVVAAADDTGEVGTIARALHVLGMEVGALGEAESSGLVVIGDGRLSFRHPLVRSAVYQAAPPATRRAAHAALAESLGDGEWRSDRRAWHRAAAAVEPDEDIAAELESTARESQQRTGYSAAALALERSAALTPVPAMAARRLFAAADANWHAGSTGRVEGLLDEALGRSSDPLLRADIQHLRGRLAHFHGDCERAYELLLHEALMVAPDDPRRAAEMLANACHSYLYSAQRGSNLDALLDALGQVEDLPGSAGAPVMVALGAALVSSGRIDEARPLLERSIPVLTESYAERRDAHLLARAANCHGWLEDYAAARDLAAHALDRARRDGAAGAVAYCAEYLGEYEMALGHTAAAIAAFDESHVVGRETGQPQIEAWAAIGLAHIAAMQGEEDECLAHLARAQACGVRLTYLSIDIVGAIVGQLADSLGDPEGAVAAYEPAVNLDAELASYIPSTTSFDLIEAYVRAGRLEAATQATARITPHVRQAWARAGLARCQGLTGAPEEFDRPFTDSIDLATRLHTPYHEAKTRLCFGERLRRAGRRTEARNHLRSALTIFEQIGATPHAKRTRTELRASGETLRTRHQDAAIDELTPQELQVAQIVADGATNKEAAARLFLSIKTIEAHLHRAYRKLGITSRDQLPLALQRAHDTMIEGEQVPSPF